MGVMHAESGIALSIVGVMMIVDPFGRTSHNGLADDHLPTDPLNKLLGVAIAIGSITVFGLEGEPP